jgi:hypothetical protein
MGPLIPALPAILLRIGAIEFGILAELAFIDIFPFSCQPEPAAHRSLEVAALLVNFEAAGNCIMARARREPYRSRDPA